MNWPILIGFVIAGLVAAGSLYFLVLRDAPSWIRIPPTIISGGTYLYLGIILAVS